MARRVAAEALVDLRRRLDRLAPRDAERGRLMAAAAELYGVSRATLYRQLREHRRPRPAYRADGGNHGPCRAGALERYCELVAALKVRTENRKGRQLSTRAPSSCSSGTASRRRRVSCERPRACSSARPSTVTWRYGDLTTTGLPGRRRRCGSRPPRQRALAARPQPLGPQAGRSPELGRARPGRADPHALQRRR